MSSEWLKVMLEEIARKKAEAAQAQAESEWRAAAAAAGGSAADDTHPEEDREPGTPGASR